MRWGDLVRLAIALAAGGATAWYVPTANWQAGYYQDGPNGGEPRADDQRVQRAIDEQLAFAAELGLTEQRGDGDAGNQEVSGRNGWSRAFRLEPGECAAFVATATGCLLLGALELREEGGQARGLGRRTVEGTDPGVVQLRWCAWGDEELAVLLSADLREDRCRPDVPRGGAVRWEVRRGSAPAVAGPDALGMRPVLDSSAHADARRASARRALAELSAGTSIGDPVESSFSRGVVLLPRSAATCHAVYAAANFGASAPRHPRLAPAVDRDAPACPPADLVSTLTRDPLAAFADGESDRVLAVVDRGALGAPCVEVTIARLRRSRRTIGVRARPLVPEGEVAELPEVGSEGWVYRDTSCPAAGLVAYVTSARDRGRYRIEVREIPAPGGAIASSAPEPTGPFPLQRFPPSNLVTAGERCLTRDDTAACLRAGRAYFSGTEVFTDHERAVSYLEPACANGSHEACTYFARALQMGWGVRRDAARALTLFRAACDEEQSAACAYLGDVERLSSMPLPARMQRAHEYYVRACADGLASACHNEAEMTRLAL